MCIMSVCFKKHTKKNNLSPKFEVWMQKSDTKDLSRKSETCRKA